MKTTATLASLNLTYFEELFVHQCEDAGWSEANSFMEKHPSVQVIKFGPGRIGLRRNKDGKIESVCFGY